MTADRIDHRANLRSKSARRARTSPIRAVDRGKCQAAFGLLLALVCLLAEARPTAAASLAVDVDDATPGIQSTISIVPSAQWTVVIRIEGVAASDALAGFELDLDFDGSVVQIVGLEAGDFLPSPTLVLENDVAVPDANLTQIALSGGAADGDGILARITFEALAEGTSELRLGDVRLARAGGGPLIPSSATQGSAFVVPEPALGLSLSIGALVSAGLTRRRRRIARSRRISATHVVFGCVLLWAGGAHAQEQRLDVNLDGWIDVLDVVAVEECLGSDPAVDESCVRADVDGDGDIDTNDRDEVVAALGQVVGPPFASAAPLFDCNRDGYPCSLSQTPDPVVARMDVLLEAATTQLNGGASLASVRDFMLAQSDMLECFLESLTLTCRTDQSPPFSIHDGATAKDVQPNPPQPPFIPSVGEFVSPKEPIGYRIVGHDRDMDGRHDREKRALILSPFDFQLGSYDPAIAARLALDPAQGPVAFQDYAGRVDFKTSPTIGLADYLDWDDYELIFLTTHGNAKHGERNATRMTSMRIALYVHGPLDPETNPSTCAEAKAAVSTPGFPINDELFCGRTNAGQVGAPDYRFAIKARPEFFDRIYPQGLENTIIWFSACRSYRFPGFRNALVGRHSAFFGWDDYVRTDYAQNAVREVLDRSARLGLRISRAWQRSCEEEGVCIEPVLRPANEKPAELVFDFDGVDLRPREVLTILDPDTLEPAEDDDVLVARFSGALEDGLPVDGPLFRFEIEGFEPEDLQVYPDPETFLRRTSFLSMDRDGGDVGSDLPLTDQFMEPVGDPAEFRWRNTEPLFQLAFDEDLVEGDIMNVTPKLRFPPSEGNLPLEPVEIGHSYDEDLDHTITACSFSASVGGAVNGSFSGLLATIGLDADWTLAARQPFDPANPTAFPFVLSVDAVRQGDLPGALTSVGATIPAAPFLRSFGWNASSGDPAPVLTINTNTDGRMTGTLVGTLRDGAETVSLSVGFDADVLTPENQLGPCIR